VVGGRVADAGGRKISGWEGCRGQEDPGVVRGEAVVVMVIAIEMQGVGGSGGVAGIENLEVGYSPTNLKACVQIPLCDIAQAPTDGRPVKKDGATN
jgi:hypothetical protein